MNISSNFAESLSDILFEKNLTIEEFAKSVNLNLSEVYLYKKKKYLPSTCNIIKIVDTYRCSIDGLLGLAPLEINSHKRASQPFAQGFAALLGKSGLTRYKFCKNTRLAPSCVDDWYHGKRLPSIYNLIIIKDYFNCTIDYLFGRE